MKDDIVNTSGELHDFVFPTGVKNHFQKVKNSEMVIALITGNYINDLQCAMEIGIAIMSGKPIGFLIEKGTDINKKLFDVADCVEVYYGENDIGDKSKKLYDRLEKFIK